MNMTDALTAALTKEFGPGFDLGTVQYAEIEDTIAAALVELGCDGNAERFPTLVDQWTTYFDGRVLANDDICEHGMSADLCAGPGHYPADDSYDDYGPRLWDASGACCAAFQLGACAHTESYNDYEDEGYAEVAAASIVTSTDTDQPF